MLKFSFLGSTSSRLRSTEAGNPFFQPFDLHVEPADLLVQLGLHGLPLLALALASVAEQALGAVEELLLPLADLDGVDLIRLGEFGDGLGLLGGLQGNLGLEGGRMPFAFAGHEAPRDGTATFDQFNIPSCPVSGVHFSVPVFRGTRARTATRVFRSTGEDEEVAASSAPEYRRNPLCLLRNTGELGSKTRER